MNAALQALVADRAEDFRALRATLRYVTPPAFR